MAHLPLEGSVVCYEFLDAKRKWLWGVGAVTHSDDRVCVISQWMGAPVDKAMTAKLESEAASSKAEAKTHQDRLLAIRERIESQSCGTSKEEKERTSEELSECLVLIGKHRNRSRSLLADLEIIKGPSTVQVKCQQFTPASSSIAILRSSILRVISHVTTPSLVLSSEEVESIEKAVTHTHSQLNSELHKLRATVEATEIESNELRDQIRNLEEQLKRVKTTFEPVRISDGGESGSAFPEKLREHDLLSLRGAWDSSTALVMTEHTIKFPWDDGDTLLHHKPEETKSVFAAEAAFACCVPIQCVTNPKMTTHGKHLSAEFSVSHPETVTTKEIDQRLASYAFPSMHLLHEEPLGVKTGLDRAIEGLEHALGIPEGKHEGLYFDEFMENMPDTTFSNDKDAYESEIGDLLMLLDKLNNENRSLQYTLDKSAAELKRQVSEAQKDHDALNTEIARLRNIVSKLKDLAEQQETELVRSRVQTQRAEEARFHYNLAPPANDSQDAEYAVTMQEYKDQKEATDNAQRALVEEKAKAEQMHHLLKMHEQQSAQNAKRLRSLQDAFAAETQQTAENFCALECELIDVLLQFKASQALTQALHHINSQQQAELFSFRARRNAALEARDADGTLPVPARPVPAGEAAERALEPQQIADEPLYAVTLEELEQAREDAARGVAAIEDNAAALESELLDVLAELKAVKGENAALRAVCEMKDAAVADLEKHDVRANNSDKAKPQTTSRHTKVFEGEEWGAVVETKPHALHDAFVTDVCAACRVCRDDLSEIAFALGSLQASVSVTHNSDISCDDIAKLVEEYHYPNVWALYAKRLAPKDGLDEAKDAISDLQLALAAKEEDAARVAEKLHEERAEAERLAKEVAAFRARRNAALEARDADGTLPVPARPVPAGEAAERALEPQQIADEPLYAVTLEEYLGKDAAVEQLAAELEEQRAEAERLAKEVAAFRARRNAALEARDADGTLPVPARPVPAGEAAERALEPQQIADEPLYAVTLEELEQAREDAARGVAAIEDNAAALESELLDVLAELKAVKGENAALRAVCEMKDAAVADLEKHDVRANNSDKAKPQTTSRHTKVFEGEEWGAVVETKPHALHDAFVTDVCAACRVCRDDLSEIAFALGSLQASVSVTHNSDISCDDIAKLVEEYHYPNVWALYAKRLAPKDGLDEAKDAISDLQLALAAKEEDAARVAEKLHEERAEAERLAKEVAAFRARRNAALEARDADGTLPVPARPVPAGEAAERALEPQQIADEPLYAVTLEEYLGKDAAVEQLAAELEEQRAEAERLAKEVAAFRARRNAALEARDADGTLPVPARPVPAGEAAERALEPQQIADEPLYAVTLEEYLGKEAAVEQLVAELEEQRAEAERLAKEVAAFRARRNAALEARDADGTLPVPARPVPAGEAAERALEPQQIADEPLYAVTLEEYLGKDAAVEQLAAELEEQRAEAERLAKEVAAFRARRNAALEARDADGTLPVPARPVPAGEAAERALEPQQIADEPLYAVTLEEYLGKDAAVEQLAAELEEQRAEAERLAKEVAAFRARRNAALEARDADGTLPVPARPVPAGEAAERALEPQQIADEPLYAVTLEEYLGKDAAVEQLAAELEEQRAEAERLAKEVAAFRARRNAALEARDADGTLPVPARPVPAGEAAERALEPQQIADEPLYAVTLEEYLGKDAAVEQLAAELEEQRAEAERLAKEVAAFRARRNAALEARDADGTLPVPARPVPAGEAAERALEPQQIADEPLYAVTLEEYLGKDAAVEQLAAELEEQRAEAERLAKEVAAFRARRNAALEARDADGTLPMPARPVPAGEAAERALEPQQIADEPLYAVTLEEYLGKDAAVEQLVAELEEQRAEAERLAKEVAAFRARRNAALEARDADGTLPVPARPVPAGEAAERALEPQQIADEPLYAVTLEEYLGKDAAVEQLVAELEEQRAEAERLAKEVAAFRARRNAALEARDADGTLPVPARPVPAGEAAERALEPQQIADEPLYAVTLEEYLGKDAAVEQLAAELEEQRAEAERLAKEVAAFRARRNAALEARDADGTLPVPARPVPAGEAAERALEPQQIADEPLYAVTLEELEQAREDAARGVAAIEDNAAALESELLDVLAELKAVKGENAALRAVCEMKDAAVADLEKHDVRANNSDKAKPQTTSRHTKVFEGEEWGAVVETKPHALHDAFVTDVCAACRVCRDDLSEIAFALGSLQASVSVTHNSDISCDDIAKLVEEYHYPNVWALYAKRLAPKDGLDEAKDAISDLQLALATKEEDAARVAEKLHEERAEAERLAKEVAAFRARRNAALEARDADGTLPVPARPVPAGEAAERALEPQQIADEPLYAVTLEEYLGKDAAVEQLAAELEEQRAEAERLAKEVAAFRARRNAALEARDADGTLPVPARPVPAGEAAERALEPQQIADEPLYAVTLEEYLGKDAAVEQLAAELEEQRAEAERLAKEVAAFRARRNAALEARDADGTLPVPARPVPAGEAAERALEPQQIADEPLYAVTLEEYLGKDAAVEQLVAELEEQRAEAERLAKEVAAFRARRNAALEARDADGTLPVPARPVPAGEAAERALEPQQIADEPLYAVTLEEYLGKDAAVEQLVAELEEQRAEAERLAKEVAAFRARRNAALEARDADGTLPVPARPVPAGEAAERALEPQQIADEPLYAVTLEEYLGKDAAVEQLVAELEEQRAEAERLAKEVAAFRARRNAALEARDADGTLPVPARPVPAGEAAERALEPQQIADEPLYAVTLEEYLGKDAAVEQLAAELEEQRAEAERLAKEVAAFRARRNAALEARDADGTLPVPARPVPAGEAAERALEPQQIADEPLYAVTLEELEQAREDAARGVAAIEDNAAALESELLDVLAELKAVKGENAALRAVCEMKDAAVADLEKHDVRANNSDKAKPQTTSRHTKVFEGEEWGAVVETKPHALHDAFVTDVCAACRVCRDDLSEIAFALGSLQASVSVTHNSDISCDDIAKLVEEYHYPNVWALYAKRLAPKDGLDEAKDAISDLQLALATKEEDAARVAEKLHEERAEAERLAKEVAAFRARRNAALEARDADGTLPVPARPVPAGEAAERALEPQQIADEPLYAVTLEEFCAVRAEAESRGFDVEDLGRQLSEKGDECGDLLEKLEEAVGLLAEARNESEDVRGQLAEAERASEAALRTMEKDRAKVAAELSALSLTNEKLVAEVRAFRRRRLDAIACREAEGRFFGEELSEKVDVAGVDVPVSPVTIEREPLFCVKLDELKEQRDLNAQMVMELSALGERIRDAMDPDAVRDPSSEAVFSHLEALLKALEESRDAEQSWRDLAEERERELEQLRKLFKNEEERWKNDLGEAQEEVERLQGELDLLTDKLDEACRLFGDADAVSAEGVAKLEAFAEVLAAARDTEKAAMEQLEAKESELEELRIALKDTKVCEEMRENLEDELKQLQKEKEITETELGAVQKEVNDLRYDLRAAEYRAAEKAREVERMTLDLDALNNRIQDLLEELKEKTDQYNQVIKDLDDFANSQSHENEKELLQRLAAREQELFELQEARRGENDEHEKQVGVLRDQINRLRDQTDQDNTLHDGLQDELARLRKLLLDAEAALRDKTAENEALKDDMESMIDEHEAQMREMEQELEGKGKEVSDALERLEEMSAMVQEAREGEESALRLRADSDAEVFRLQKELDKIKRLQSAMAESGDDKSSLFAQIIDTEGQLRDAVATIRKKDAQLDEVEKEWQKKLNKSEDLNHDLRRLLKRTMAALSKSKDTMGNSAGALDAFRDELKPMMQ
ncbi:flagellar_attachment_zone_protein_-_putative [Leishmania infantum]|uniref:Flagellar_attachment_zone_protein_-_putative n=1 Tax=Leishmania infantum TaxID=5671 RepID=A0A6L0XPE1_LEIIN|nr:flagellar_attachment_zone_protein_-_putative [Leishmania infantum]SUZ45619.1 flagellar_attachment_zone_protein_-_putative [Leishmania infantum]